MAVGGVSPKYVEAAKIIEVFLSSSSTHCDYLITLADSCSPSLPPC
jgi:hypothetical protein